MGRNLGGQGSERRNVLRGLAATAGAALFGCAAKAAGSRQVEATHAPAPTATEISPCEDLMQEHAVLERVLLVYYEAGQRMAAREEVDASLVITAAGVVQRFVHDYHERHEEEEIFLVLEAARREAPLVAIHRQQHLQARELTGEIIEVARHGASQRLALLTRGFARLYRPHAAREATVLYPAFRAVVGANDYRNLGAPFESWARAQFGSHPFDGAVAQVAKLESAFGIDDPAGQSPFDRHEDPNRRASSRLVPS